MRRLGTIVCLLTGAIALLDPPSALAFRAPKSGDWVTYEQNLTLGGKPYNGQWGRRIEQVNETTGQFLIKWSNSYGMPEHELWVSQLALNYVENNAKLCETFKNHGNAWSVRIEKVQTPAGEFSACRVEKNSGTYVGWFSEEVPFGLLKEQYIYGDGSRGEQFVIKFGW